MIIAQKLTRRLDGSVRDTKCCHIQFRKHKIYQSTKNAASFFRLVFRLVKIELNLIF